MIGKFYNKLLRFDEEYFRPFGNEDKTETHAWRVSTIKDLAYALATWAFDNGFEVDEDSWELLDQIEQHFGPRVREKVLYNMFHRQHDT